MPGRRAELISATIRIPCLRSPLRCKGLEIKPKCIAESDEPHRHENKRTAVRTNEVQLFAFTSVALWRLQPDYLLPPLPVGVSSSSRPRR